MKVSFKINLGDESVNIPHGILIKLYGIRECESILLSEFIVHKNIFRKCISENCFTFFYVVAEIQLCKCHKNKISFLSIFKKCSKYVYINEQTTIANIFCFMRSMKINKCNIDIHGDNEILDISYGMKNNFIYIDGQISDVIKSNPNGLETNSYPLFNYLSNLIYYTIIDPDIKQSFLILTNAKTVTEGIFNMARNPFLKVTEIYNLIKDKTAIYKPALNTLTLPHWKDPSGKPNQWTLTIKLNKSGSKNFLIGGPAYIIFDKNNRAWLTNNVRQGTPNSSTFCTILEPNGEPASFSPLFGGGLLGAGFGIATNKCKDLVAISNFGWGVTDYNPQDGSISLIKSDGTILSPSDGFTNGFTRAQGVFYDHDGNLWISSWGTQDPLGGNGSNTFDFESKTSRVVVYIKGDPNNYTIFEFENEYFKTFDVIVDADGNAYVTNSGNEHSPTINSSIYHLRLINDKLVEINKWTSDKPEAFRQVTISPSGFVFVVAVITNRVLKFDKDLNFIEEFTNEIDGPWGITFDCKGTMFVANFKRDTVAADLETFDMEGKFGITIVYNEDDSTAKLVTLPSGGDQVMLANGFPLYGSGSGSKPSYEPLMRSTGSGIDKAGNLWVMNNWKPSLMTDLDGNPGGDGIVIFIGLTEICK